MRSRKEIEKDSFNQADKTYNNRKTLDTQIEILLDIRDLLMDIEIGSGYFRKK